MSVFSSLPAVWQAFFASLFTFALTALGAALVFFSAKPNQKAIAAATGCAAGIMLSASFFSLLLPALSSESRLPPFVVLTVGVLCGGCFITLTGVALERAGHRLNENKRRCALLFSAITLHNIPEGMAIGVAFGAAAGMPAGVAAATLLTLGIGIQNFPEGACIAYPLRSAGFSTFRSFFLSQSSGFIEVPSAVLGAVCASVATGVMPWLLAFSAGAMVSAVCTELLPDCIGSHKTLASFGVVVGFCLMTFLDLALG